MAEKEIENDVEVFEEVDGNATQITGWVRSRDASFTEEAVIEDFYYTILASKNFRSNSDYVVQLTLLKGNADSRSEPIEVSVVIEDEQDENDFRVEKVVELELNQTKSVALPIGNISSENCYKLIVEGLKGIQLKCEASLDVQTKNVALFIQTDKAIYKPNDVVKFRVLAVNQQLKPAPIENLNIIVSDPSMNRIKQWQNVKTTKGVFADEFQISDIPNLGEWRILAEFGDEKKISVIMVAEFVLPKFDVTIDASDHFVIRDGVVRAVIRAKYTHGLNLNGRAVVRVTEEYPFDCYYLRDKKPEQITMKNVDIVDGCGEVKFDIVNELKFDPNDKYDDYKKFNIEVEVYDKHFPFNQDLAQTNNVTVIVHKYPVVITTDLDANGIVRETTFDYTISVRNHDHTSVKINDGSKQITIIEERFYLDVDESTKTEKVYELNENGDVILTTEAKRNDASFSLKAKYGDHEYSLGMYYMQPQKAVDRVGLNANILTERCVINEPIEIEVSSHHQLESYSYVVSARGKIIEAKTNFFSISESGSVHRFTLLPTFECTPKIQIVLYILINRALCSKKLTIELRQKLENVIDVSATPTVAKPGEVVHVSVTSSPKSYIGILGIDQSVLLLRGGNDLAMDDIWNELDMFRTQVAYARFGMFDPSKPKVMKPRPQYVNYWEDFDSLGLILFTNTDEPIQVRCAMKLQCDEMNRMVCFGSAPAMSRRSISAPPPPAVKVRKEFPETWIWHSINDDSFDGKLVLQKKVPDTLTSWILTAFSLSPDHGLGVTETPTKVMVRQPFFVTVNLPYAVKRGEVVNIPCTVFNTLESDVETEVTLENVHNEFEFVDAKDEQKLFRKVQVHSNNTAIAQFLIRPTKVGSISFKISAISPIAGDAVVRTLLVKPEGVPQFVNKSVLVDLREKNKFEPTIVDIEFPKEKIVDSERIEVTCIGDMLGGTVKNLQRLIRLPYGCGEQNMLNFVPNIVVLNYLKNTHQLTPEIEAKAKRFMEIGYQRELTYKHKDGSFSAFGEQDKSGSTWLTAFVAKSFCRAADHISVDENIIENALAWLNSTQKSDGSFVERGSICHREMQGGSSNGVALTAYVLTAFLENQKYRAEYTETIGKAIQNIVESIKSAKTDVYALALGAYALHLAEHEARGTVLKQLINVAKCTDTFKWWDKSDNASRESKTINVEITSYALLTLLLAQQDAQCLPILKWLLNQRNDRGGFEGTQDTILGIEALAQIATKIASKERNVVVRVAYETLTNEKQTFEFNVSPDNSLVLQSKVLPKDSKNVKIEADGHGCALVEVSYRYNVKEAETNPAFIIKSNAQLLNPTYMQLNITAKFIPPSDDFSQSNMAVLEVELPSGFVVNAHSLDSIKRALPSVKKIETKNADTVAVVYFDHLTKDEISLKIDAFRNHDVDEQKPVAIVLYDYYDNALSAREFYLPSPVAVHA